MTGLVTNIQRYAIHDGGGIRTTVFFKGCPLQCAWCHNPETIDFTPEGATHYTPDKLAQLVMRDHIFYGDTGGVTLSGGEPLAQDINFLVDFLKRLKQRGIHIACDTCGDVPWERFEAALPYVDLFLYDIKMATPALHKKYTGRHNGQITDNLTKLAAQANVWLRVPVVGGVNDGNEMAAIIGLAKAAAPARKVSLLPYHHLAAGKWEKLNQPAPNFYTPCEKTMTARMADWRQAGFDADIGG